MHILNRPEDLAPVIASIEPADQVWFKRAERYQMELTKPPGSLGRLEQIANQICAIQRTLEPSVTWPSVYVFAGDHGICEEGVNPYPQEVTRQMVRNFLSGGAAINAIARSVGARLQVVDMGIRFPIGAHTELKLYRIGPGTRNFRRQPAMSEEAACRAISAGMDCAAEAIEAGSKLLAVGEMGIGNTTAASALTAFLTGLPAASVCGRGTGADDKQLAQKIAVVEQALQLHGPHLHSPFDALQRLGGFELGAICGFCLQAAKARCAVLVDGFIATASAAVAAAMAPAVSSYLIASHLSGEHAHGALLNHLGWKPLLNLEMRLGEGTGAALAIPIVRAAVEAFGSMATFASASVSNANDPAEC